MAVQRTTMRGPLGSRKTVRQRPDIPIEPQQWLTPKQVAAMLQVSLRFVQELIHRGELPASTIGTLRRIDRQDVSRFMAARRTPTTAACAT